MTAILIIVIGTFIVFAVVQVRITARHGHTRRAGVMPVPVRRTTGRR